MFADSPPAIGNLDLKRPLKSRQVLRRGATVLVFPGQTVMEAKMSSKTPSSRETGSLTREDLTLGMALKDKGTISTKVTGEKIPAHGESVDVTLKAADRCGLGTRPQCWQPASPLPR